MKKVLWIMSPIIMVCAIFFQSGNAKSRFIEEDDNLLELLVDTIHRQGRMYFKEGISISQDLFLKDYGLELGLLDNDSLGLYKSEEDTLGFKHYRYSQYHNGIKVEGAVYQIHEKNNSIRLAHGLIVKGIKVPPKPILSEKEALYSALESIDASLYAWQDTSWENDRKRELKDASASWFPEGSLVYYAETDKNYDLSDGNRYKLAYKFIVHTLIPFDNIVVYVDSETAECLGKGSMVKDANGTVATVYNGTKSVTTHYRSFPNYDYVLRDKNTASEIITRNTEFDFWGDLKSFGSTDDIDENDNQWALNEDEHAASSLWAVESAYYVFSGYFGRTYGMRSYAHQIRVYNHHNELLAFSPTDLGDYIYIGNWLGISIYDSYSGSLDAIAHEFTHGVSTSACDLGYDDYNYISGAIFESFSDIFGEFVEYQTLGSNDWIVGTNLINEMKRSLSDPTLYDAYEYSKVLNGYFLVDVSFSYLQPYPVIYGDANWVSGVGPIPAHINLMVQNRMFYLLSQGGNQNGVTVSGIGIHKAAGIAYRAMCTYSDINTTWSDSRDNFYDAAKDLYGINSCEARETRNAWAAAGIGTASYASCNPPVSATISGSSYLCDDGNETYTANPSGGTGVYSYDWYVDYGNGWYHFSSYSSVTLWGYNYPTNSVLDMKLVVTSGTEQCTVYKNNISVYDCGYRSFNVFPNPANDILNISILINNVGDISSESKKDAVNVSITGSTGAIYYNRSFYSTDFTVPINDIPEGLNIVSIRIGDNRYSKQVIIKH